MRQLNVGHYYFFSQKFELGDYVGCICVGFIFIQLSNEKLSISNCILNINKNKMQDNNDNLCRLCLQIKVNLFNIFENCEDETVGINEIISEHLRVQVNSTMAWFY